MDGKEVELPLTGRKIPIIGDAQLVDMEFGTGAVKVTPAHDFNDFEVGKRHKLPMINILNLDGTLNENAPAKYRGMTVVDARKAVVADLEAAGLLVKIEPHQLSLGRCQRSDDVVEPMLSPQWFVKMEPLAEPAIDAVNEGKTKFIPEAWTKTYMHWMTNIRDWCISRQLWWGHRIPAWYCGERPHHRRATTTPTACSDVRRRRSSSRTRTCSTPGSRRRSGRSRRWAGPSRRASSRPSIRRRSWRPATTSSSSGSPA